jgi:hypothetical protein
MSEEEAVETATLNKILSGQVTPGDYLPPLAADAQLHGVTVHAVARARERLRQAGYLELGSGQRPKWRVVPMLPAPRTRSGELWEAGSFWRFQLERAYWVGTDPQGILVTTDPDEDAVQVSADPEERREVTDGRYPTIREAAIGYRTLLASGRQILATRRRSRIAQRPGEHARPITLGMAGPAGAGAWLIGWRVGERSGQAVIAGDHERAEVTLAPADARFTPRARPWGLASLVFPTDRRRRVVAALQVASGRHVAIRLLLERLPRRAWEQGLEPRS